MTKLSLFVLLALVAQSALTDARLLARGDGFFKKMFGKKKGGRNGGGNGNGNGGTGGGGRGGGKRGNGGGGTGGGANWDDVEVGTLGPEAVQEVLFMREEEKMARDVYLTMFEKYGSSITPVFENIAKSEQNHMDRMLDMINLYGLTDPVASDEIGVFTNTELGETYTTLVNQGENSLLDALFVGALIEETDIEDLREAIDSTTESVLQQVYSNLLKASYNHLNAFVRHIELQGGTYEPTILTAEDVGAILGD